MSKEQEALDNFLKEYLSLCEKLNTNMQEKMLLDSNSPYNVLKTYLKSIDNANPSEALECLEDIYRNGVFISEVSFEKQHPTNISPETNKSIDVQCNTIKQALLKAREQEKENELLKEIIKSFFDRGCPLHQYTDKSGILQIEVDNECSTMHLGKFKDVDLDEKLKEVLE